MKKIIFVATLLLSLRAATLPRSLAGAGIPTPSTVNAASCNYSDVQSAVSAANDGDTVSVPAGSCNWPDTLSIAKRIRLIGNNTVITSDVSNTLSYVLVFQFPVEMSGFTIDANNRASCVAFVGDTTTPFVDAKIHDNTFRECKTRGVLFQGLIYGAFYSNTLIDGGQDFSSYAGGSNGWDAPYGYGNANNIFVEDNNIQHPNDFFWATILDTGQGGRIVFRHNTLTGYISFDMLDAHGNQGPWPTNRGSVIAEIYDNTFSLTPGTYANWRFYTVRGGQVMAFNNRITSSNGQGNANSQVTEEDGYLAAFGCPCPLHDTVVNTFFWNNTINGNPVSFGYANAADATNVPLGTAWFVPASGPLASRPTNSANGTYYGATDTEVLYQRQNGAWTAIYAPFTYPHPLRTATPPPPPPPPPPPTCPTGAGTGSVVIDGKTVCIQIKG